MNMNSVIPQQVSLFLLPPRLYEKHNQWESINLNLNQAKVSVNLILDVREGSLIKLTGRQ